MELSHCQPGSHLVQLVGDAQTLAVPVKPPVTYLPATGGVRRRAALLSEDASRRLHRPTMPSRSSQRRRYLLTCSRGCCFLHVLPSSVPPASCHPHCPEVAVKPPAKPSEAQAP
uniref:Uncharacterized protein n=1 Tax=Oryza punctata TaxID=4537 RepID=A0A0E0LCU0_ORYPU